MGIGDLGPAGRRVGQACDLRVADLEGRFCALIGVRRVRVRGLERMVKTASGARAVQIVQSIARLARDRASGVRARRSRAGGAEGRRAAAAGRRSGRASPRARGGGGVGLGADREDSFGVLVLRVVAGCHPVHRGPDPRDHHAVRPDRAALPRRPVPRWRSSDRHRRGPSPRSYGAPSRSPADRDCALS
jgi:hypothetical protein